MKKLLTFALLLTATAAFAQELLPALKPLAEKYGNDRLTLVGAPWEKAYAKILEPYAAALNAAQKEATAKGQLLVLKAIEAEQEGLGDGMPGTGAGLPRSVASSRATFLAELAKLNGVRALNTQRVDVAYLQALLDLYTKSTGNPTLQAQITAERKRVLASTRTTAATPSPKNLITFPIHGEGWAKGNGKVEELEENGVKFTRISGGKFWLDIELPAAKTLKLTAQLRSVTGLPKREYGVLVVSYQDATGKYKTLLASNTPEGTGKTWKVVSPLNSVPPGVTTVRLEILPLGAATFDVRDLTLSVK